MAFIDEGLPSLSDGTLLAQNVPWYKGEPHPNYQRIRLVIAYLELGLRWLHDHSGNEYYRWIDKAEEHGWSHE